MTIEVGDTGTSFETRTDAHGLTPFEVDANGGKVITPSECEVPTINVDLASSSNEVTDLKSSTTSIAMVTMSNIMDAGYSKPSMWKDEIIIPPEGEVPKVNVNSSSNEPTHLKASTTSIPTLTMSNIMDAEWQGMWKDNEKDIELEQVKLARDELSKRLQDSEDTYRKFVMKRHMEDVQLLNKLTKMKENSNLYSKKRIVSKVRINEQKELLEAAIKSLEASTLQSKDVQANHPTNSKK